MIIPNQTNNQKKLLNTGRFLLPDGQALITCQRLVELIASLIPEVNAVERLLSHFPVLRLPVLPASYRNQEPHYNYTSTFSAFSIIFVRQNPFILSFLVGTSKFFFLVWFMLLLMSKFHETRKITCHKMAMTESWFKLIDNQS